ncbi:hypothetical protein P7C71_g2162, partial [Lecanoromycetidae sp. Uapishka_2]
MRLGTVLRRIPSVIVSYVSTSFRRLRARPGAFAFIGFLFIYVALIRYCSVIYYRDPTSAFFDPARGYQKLYSARRQEDVDLFIHNANVSSFPQITPKKVRMCVGIATIAREQEQYVKRTIGSLLDGLTPNDRAEIYFAVLIAHTASNEHPVYGEQWLTNVVDKVLLYDVSQKKADDLLQWETAKDYRKKAIFDYTYVLQKCVDTGAQWIAMVEDDTLAVDGWYARAIEALETADEQHPPTKDQDWLYMRMFYTEEFLGWNAEEWPRYLIGSIAVVGMTTMVFLLVRQCMFEKYITNTVLLVVAMVCCPACILLYFAAGRISMQPLVPGVYQMPKFGCCAQGLIFSAQTAPRVIARLAQKREGFVDEIIEAWANEANLVRWVVVPSLLQHLGAHSSKGDDFGDKAKHDRSVAEKIWNFGFELYNDKMT